MSTSLVVLGPTASGKSDVAMSVATDPGLVEHGPFEIVAVDAMQVYRRMDIGTAKPTADDRDRVPHHLLDLVDPDHEFAVAEFVDAATTAAAEIAARGNRALLVGGTGLYLRALTDPMEIPGTWPVVRAALEARLAHESVEALHAELTALDPDAAAKMEPTNARRVVRALEVCVGSGRRFSSYGPGLDRYPPVPFVQVGLRWPRPVLARRIETRVHRMVEAGLVAEVASLVERFPGLSRTARQALGYKEVIEHLEGLCSLDEAVATVVVRTRQFAVRQERWFRRDPRVRWLDIHDDPVAEAVPVIAATLMGTR
ncbi:MAG: tRNA (adenosine(37)-N6)-dimethylallyltransferase MiaA [Acidimicrobiales bacterium]|nr:tRNA (adenosine(37)-N6)-dimethylallyltransferase MiaA [Acidimicrobiales bacterium]MCB9394584.1 tRNA (adenosine(37)-N6)-dimethylallyltransferase MiaA [Acidimicrobiaceae bacterium]